MVKIENKKEKISSSVSEKRNSAKEKDFKLDLEEMARVGLHFGHKTSKIHPGMNPYLFGARNGVHLINLEKTEEKLKEALNFIRELILEDKILLFVGTKIQVKDAVKNTAVECGMPYVIERWLGGTFSNFDIIKKRIEYFKELESKKNQGELEKYTKKERVQIDKELSILELKFGGIKELTRLPDAIFVTDIKKDYLALKEARDKGVKVVAISDTNVDPSLADYPIPANDDAISSVKYILDKIRDVVINTKPKAVK